MRFTFKIKVWEMLVIYHYSEKGKNTHYGKRLLGCFQYLLF